MKLLLSSICIAFLLVIANAVLVVTINSLPGDFGWLFFLIRAPFRLPEIITEYFFPLRFEEFESVSQMAHSPKVIASALFELIFNILLYSIPIYLLLKLLARTKSPAVKFSDAPPAPPTF